MRNVYTPPPKASTQDQATPTTWTFKIPNLSHGSPWYNQRVRNLKKAARKFENRDKLIREGLLALRRHRQNYGPSGPKHLQLLWWEWPKRHWNNLIHGFPMNFTSNPPRVDNTTGHKDVPEQKLQAMADCVDELISLGVLIEGEVISSASVFTVDKPELEKMETTSFT